MSFEINLSYPIGKFDDDELSKSSYDEKIKAARLLDFQLLPSMLEQAIANLDEYQLNVPYREGGWTSKQVIHHVADSHMNAYIRFKLALTEDNPVIKPYNEAAWAELIDTQTLPVNISLTLLHALHTRWVVLMKGMAEEDWQRTLFHPVQNRQIKLWNLLGNYAWHGRHHVAHITSLREKMEW